MNKKQSRYTVIKKIIENQPIGSQEELLSLLKDNGYNLTQATLSRDIKQLKISKIPDSKGNYVYQLPDKNENSIISYGFISIDFSGNLGVIKTRPGYAMSIAYEIDKQISHEILGTIAGDDTILLILKEGITQNEIIKSLLKLIPKHQF